MAVTTSSYSVKTYFEYLRILESDPIRPGCFDIHPEHQREFITTNEWANALICHFMFHNQLNPVIYHKVRDDDGVSFYESLDGKQRSSAFIRLLKDEFVFKNVKTFPHHDPMVNSMLEACHGKYFRQWPEKYQSEFLHKMIQVTTYDFEMPEKMRADFFADLQNTKRTKIGEVLHSYETTSKLMKLIRGAMKDCEWRRVWKTKPSRYCDLHVFTCMAYHFIKAPESTKDVANTDLLAWVENHSDEVDMNKFNEFLRAAKMTMDIMHQMGGISHASSKNTVLAFFFLILRKTDRAVIAAIGERFSKTKTLDFPNVVGKADQAYRRYMHLVNNYIV